MVTMLKATDVTFARPGNKDAKNCFGEEELLLWIETESDKEDEGNVTICPISLEMAKKIRHNMDSVLTDIWIENGMKI